jgi:hypothetical protein
MIQKIVHVVDVGATHKSNPSCKMRLAQDRYGTYCIDCGLYMLESTVNLLELVSDEEYPDLSDTTYPDCPEMHDRLPIECNCCDGDDNCRQKEPWENHVCECTLDCTFDCNCECHNNKGE